MVSKTTTTKTSNTFEIDCTLSYQLPAATDFVFLVHALDGMDQKVLKESLELSKGARVHISADPWLKHRIARVQAPAGELNLRYTARVRRRMTPVDTSAAELPVAKIPDDILHNLMPTRYCESDLLARAAFKLFGAHKPGFARVQAITDWLYENIDYQVGTTQATTTAADVFRSRVGVCRDFAHLGVSFCRALNIPARLVVGYAIFDEPPPDFHAAFEAYLGKRWVMFDGTRLSPPEHLVRIASGRDAKDVAFATMFGAAQMLTMNPLIRLLP